MKVFSILIYRLHVCQFEFQLPSGDVLLGFTAPFYIHTAHSSGVHYGALLLSIILSSTLPFFFLSFNLQY